MSIIRILTISIFFVLVYFGLLGDISLLTKIFSTLGLVGLLTWGYSVKEIKKNIEIYISLWNK